jgi:ATP-dependent protease HslVU (ClpYQ) peptidase subunit
MEEYHMTCVAGIVKGSRVYIAGDSAGSNDWHQLTLRLDKKVFRRDDLGMIFGCCGSFRMIQMLHYVFAPPLPPSEEELDHYMATTFINAVRSCFLEGGFAKKKEEREKGGHFLVGVRGRLFEIESDYQVGESLDGYAAIGSGDDVALGVLFATHHLDMSPEQRLMLALEGAQHHITSVRAPFLIEYLECDPFPLNRKTAGDEEKGEPFTTDSLL